MILPQQLELDLFFINQANLLSDGVMSLQAKDFTHILQCSWNYLTHEAYHKPDISQRLNPQGCHSKKLTKAVTVSLY